DPQKQAHHHHQHQEWLFILIEQPAQAAAPRFQYDSHIREFPGRLRSVSFELMIKQIDRRLRLRDAHLWFQPAKRPEEVRILGHAGRVTWNKQVGIRPRQETSETLRCDAEDGEWPPV